MLRASARSDGWERVESIGFMMANGAFYDGKWWFNDGKWWFNDGGFMRVIFVFEVVMGYLTKKQDLNMAGIKLYR